MKQITRGVQELDSKGLIDTVEEIKNEGPDSQQKDLSSQLQWRRQFLDGKSNLTKTITLMWRRLLNIWGLGRGWPPWKCPYGLQDDTRANGPKEVAQHLSRFWMSNCFMNPRWLRIAMDLNLVALERLWNYLSNHIKISSNRLRMWPWRRFWCRLFLESEKETKSKLKTIRTSTCTYPMKWCPHHNPHAWSAIVWAKWHYRTIK